MKGFTKWLVKHRIAVIILCIALMIPSVLGMAATKTKYDLLYYLPQDLETVQGQEITCPRTWRRCKVRKSCFRILAKGPFPCWSRRA